MVDASALAALLFSELEAEAVAVRIGGVYLVAPALLGFELANVYLIKPRRHPDQQPALVTAFRLGDWPSVEEITVDHDGTVELVAATGLTAYEASSLGLP